MEYTFVVWNTQRKALQNEVAELCHQYNADFIILIENTGSSSQLTESLDFRTSVNYLYDPNTLNFRNGHLYYKSGICNVRTLTEHPRYSIKEITISNDIFNLAIVHLPSKNNWGNSADHDAICTELKADIDFHENVNGHRKTIVTGDFNMNPFENGMVNAAGLHSVMDKLIAANGHRSIYNKEYHYFYNPMWAFLGTYGKGNLSGTNYHNTGKYLNYYWNMYDQVLIRPDLLPYFDDDDLEIVENINSVRLTKVVRGENRIDTEISDHLPIKFKLKI